MSKNQAGFTLMELLIAIVVVMAVTGWAISTSTTMESAYAQRSGSREMFTFLQVARSEAIRTGRNVLLVTEDNKVGREKRRFVLRLDKDGNRVVSDADTLFEDLELQSKLMSENKIENGNPLIFNSRGQMVDTAGQPTVGTIVLCRPKVDGNGEEQDDCNDDAPKYEILVNVAGIPTVTKHEED